MSCRIPPWMSALTTCLAILAGCTTWSAPRVPLPGMSASQPTVDGPELARREAAVNDKYKGNEIYSEKKKDESFLDRFSADSIVKSVKSATGSGPNPNRARNLFAEGEVLYGQALAASAEKKAELFTLAAEKYTEAAERWPGSVLAEDAWFLAGEGYFFADNYPSARTMYDYLTKLYPNSRHLDVVDARRFAIAQFWLEMDRKTPQSWYEVNMFDDTRPWRDTSGYAHKVFERIRLDDPTGKLADDATMASANAYFLAGDFMAADDLYTDLRKSFPSSEHQFDAHFLGLKTKLECYDGPDYSDDALEQAEVLVKQIRKQFPHKAAEEKDYLDRAYAEIRFRKAERLWSLGRYYELQYAYGASNLQFQRIVDEYPETPFAKVAEESIKANAGKPAVPPQPFEPIVKMFPQRQIAKPLISNDDPATGSSRRR